MDISNEEILEQLRRVDMLTRRQGAHCGRRGQGHGDFQYTHMNMDAESCGCHSHEYGGNREQGHACGQGGKGHMPEGYGFGYGPGPRGFEHGHMPEGFEHGHMPEGFEPGPRPEGHCCHGHAHGQEDFAYGRGSQERPQGFGPDHHPEGPNPAERSRHGQGRVLTLLAMKGGEGLNQKDLAYLLGIRPQSLGETLAKLEEKGYIKRTQNSADRRATIVTLTDAGKEHAEEVARHRKDAADEVLSVLTDEEKQQLSAILAKLCNALDGDVAVDGNGSSSEEAAGSKEEIEGEEEAEAE